jgi:hypothetical protein
MWTVRDFRHTCAGTGLTPATSAPGLGSPLPHLRRDWVHRCHICMGTALPLPHLHWDWAYPCHTCAGTGLTPATPAPGLGPSLPHLRRDWAYSCHTCAGTGPIPATSAPGLRSPLPHLRRDWAHPCHICAGTGLAVLATSTAAFTAHQRHVGACAHRCIGASVHRCILQSTERRGLGLGATDGSGRAGLARCKSRKKKEKTRPPRSHRPSTHGRHLDSDFRCTSASGGISRRC